VFNCNVHTDIELCEIRGDSLPLSRGVAQSVIYAIEGFDWRTYHSVDSGSGLDY
jgi:hypothetical protein